MVPGRTEDGRTPGDLSGQLYFLANRGNDLALRGSISKDLLNK